MGKIANELNWQMGVAGLEKQAQQCKAIYDKLKEMDGGHIWERKWSVLMKVCSRSNSDGKVEFYRAPTAIGEIFLKGLAADKHQDSENDSDKELLVLCSTDEDNTKETYLTISKEDLKAGIHNERIVSELRKIFCVDDYVAQVGDEGEQEFQEAVESLLQGRDAAFECYEWYWQTVLAL